MSSILEENNQTQILSRVTPATSVERQRELEQILRFARESKSGRGLLVLSPPLAGASELLRKIYDRLFFADENIFPVYFAFEKSDESAEACARRFLRTFLLQAMAFLRQEPRLIAAKKFDSNEIAQFNVLNDTHWIDRLLVATEDIVRRGDEQAFIQQAFAAPLRAIAHKVRTFVIIDDLHLADASLFEEIKRIYAHSTVSFVLSGHRRALIEELQTGENALQNTESIFLPPFTYADANALVEKLRQHFKIQISEQARDLIVHQLEANPALISSLIEQASRVNSDLGSFEQCQQIYAAEVLRGQINRYFSAKFEEAADKAATQNEIVKLLHDALTKENTKSPLESWRNSLPVSDDEFTRIMRSLSNNEIIYLNTNFVDVSETSYAARDYIEARHRAEVQMQQKALVYSQTLASVLKRAPELLANHYRRTTSLGLRKLLSFFHLQKIPAILFDSLNFQLKFENADDDKIKTEIKSETEKITLPQIVYATSCKEFYPLIERIADTESAAVGLGFESGSYRDENQIVWIAAEIDSKSEASLETVEFWLDRLEAVALYCNFTRVQYWLVAKHGFNEEAVKYLRQRNVFNSNKKQIEFVAGKIAVGKNGVQKHIENVNEFELVIPIGDDTELIAAQALEEIARRYNFKPAAINQIKTALVEACLNAAEHSLSQDRKIYQKFVVTENSLIITVSNRGLQTPLERKNGTPPPHDNAADKRDFSLQLIRALMDEVEFTRTDDSTKISMTKRK